MPGKTPRRARGNGFANCARERMRGRALRRRRDRLPLFRDARLLGSRFAGHRLLTFEGGA